MTILLNGLRSRSTLSFRFKGLRAVRSVREIHQNSTAFDLGRIGAQGHADRCTSRHAFADVEAAIVLGGIQNP